VGAVVGAGETPVTAHAAAEHTPRASAQLVVCRVAASERDNSSASPNERRCPTRYQCVLEC
jgi:hypothetical protein